MTRIRLVAVCAEATVFSATINEIAVARRAPRRATDYRTRETRTCGRLSATIGGTPQATDLFALFDDTIQRLLAGLK